jgi:TrmH family RNA methyltransferase
VTAPPVVVLVEPQDLVNIAATVRIAKNFAISDLRLVNPQQFDPYRIEGIAHNTGDLVERIRMFDRLDDAIADCVWAVALSARERTAKRRMLRPPAAAAELTARSAEGPVAMVFGREDSGLTNAELDRCHAICAIATNPGHRSLNLAQAVAIMGYECWNAREGAEQARKPPRRRAVRARAADVHALFHDVERTLYGVEFFKSRNAENVMRSFQEIAWRADLDGREVRLLRAMALEVVHYLVRRGVAPELPERLARPGGAAGDTLEGAEGEEPTRDSE